MTPRSGRTMTRPPARWLLAIGLIAVSAAVPGTAHAFWSEVAAGSGTAEVTTLPEIGVTASSPQFSSRAEVSWTAADVPAGMTVEGYHVQRVTSSGTFDACGTSSSAPASATTFACTDWDLADGESDYVVTALVGSWTTTGQTPSPVLVAADRTGPEVRLSSTAEDAAVVDRRGGQHLLFFSSSTGGSLRLDAEVTDPGVGPAAARFPAIATSGWTHAFEEVTDGTGAEPTITYRSSVFSIEAGAATPPVLTVTGVDDRGNEGATTLVPVDDTTAPSGGELWVNGARASTAGATSVATGSFTIGLVTAFVEEATGTQSGLASVALVRESAALTAGACGPFGGPTTLDLDAPGDQSGLADGCYRYTLSGTDLVGNEASVHTIVRLDSSAPSGGALSANGTDAAPAGSTSYSRTGAWTVNRTDFTDGGTGIASSSLVRSTSPLASGACGATWSDSTVSGEPGESGVTTGCVRYTLTGTDNAGLASSISTTVLVDTAAPTGGSLTVNGVAATGTGSSSTATSGSVTVQSVTDFADANAGMQSTVLTRMFAPMSAGVCGAFDTAGAETVGGAVTLVGLPDGCHRFTLTGTDLAGNTASVSSTVRLDASAPMGGSLVAAGVTATPTGLLAYARANTVPVAWTKFADPESGMTTARVQRTTSTSLANGICGSTYGSASNLTTTLLPVTGTSAQTLSTGTPRCYRYVLTGVNALGVSSSLEVTVMFDASNPTSTGSLRVNSSTGTASTSTTGSFTVSALRTYADAQSGLVSSTLTRTWAPVVANVCGAFDPATTEAVTGALPIAQGPLAAGCYRYTQTATNLVGGSSSVSTTVRVDTTAPTGGALGANGTAAITGTGSVSTSATGAWTVERTDFTDPESMLTSTLTRAVATSLSNGSCGRFGGASTVTGAPVESGLVTGCVRYVLAGRNSLNLSAPSLTVTVRVDTTPPTGGALRVNGVNASAAGTTSTSTTGTFTISTRTAMSDPHTGVTTTTVTRTSGPTCSELDPDTETAISGSLPITQTGLGAGCHRYVLASTNGAGLTSTISTSVVVPPSVVASAAMPSVLASADGAELIAPTSDDVTSPVPLVLEEPDGGPVESDDEPSLP
jgi:hypothetical protein